MTHRKMCGTKVKVHQFDDYSIKE